MNDVYIMTCQTSRGADAIVAALKDEFQQDFVIKTHQCNYMIRMNVLFVDDAFCDKVRAYANGAYYMIRNYR